MYQYVKLLLNLTRAVAENCKCEDDQLLEVEKTSTASIIVQCCVYQGRASVGTGGRRLYKVVKHTKVR